MVETGPRDLPDGITPEMIRDAIAEFQAGTPHGFGDSTGYDVVYQGGKYPPKAIVGLAAAYFLCSPLQPSDFKGGIGSKCFRVLESCGFEIQPKEARSSYLLAWNPSNYQWDDYEVCINRIQSDGAYERRWSCGNTRARSPGDRVYLMRLGVEPKGLIGSGIVLREPYEDEHWHDSNETARYVSVRLDVSTSHWTSGFEKCYRSQLQLDSAKIRQQDSERDRGTNRKTMAIQDSTSSKRRYTLLGLRAC